MIYFIQQGHDGPIKIGVSSLKGYQERISALQTGSAKPLEILSLIPGDFELEKQIHDHLQEFRLHGEWFEGNHIVKDFALNPDFDKKDTGIIDCKTCRLCYVLCEEDVKQHKQLHEKYATGAIPEWMTDYFMDVSASIFREVSHKQSRDVAGLSMAYLNWQRALSEGQSSFCFEFSIMSYLEYILRFYEVANDLL